MRLSRSVSARVLAVAVALGAPVSFTACGGGGKTPGSGNSALVTMTTTSIANAITGVAYSAQFAAQFPHAPGIFVVTGGALPLGLALDKSTGILSGFPRQVGAFQFEIAARDGFDTSIPQQRDATFAEARRTFSVVVSLGLPNILPQQPPTAQYRASYAYQIDVAGGTAPYTFAQVGGALPGGVTISPSGLLASFPTQAVQHPYTFSVKVTDALGKTDTDTLTLDVIVLPLIILTASPIQPGAQFFAYDVPLDLASSGGGQPITWSQAWLDSLARLTPLAPGSPPPLAGTPYGVGVSLPAGDTLLSTLGMEIANIAGQGRFRVALPNAGPLLQGTFSFTAGVTDEAGQFVSRQYSFTVKLGPVLNTVSPKLQVSGGPITLTGLNFQPGAVIVFKPGPSEIQVTPSTLSSTVLTLNAVPPTPAGGAGFVTVRVKNPDGGFSDKLNGYGFPAANMTFNSTAVFPSPNSGLSSTGLDVADINGDGFADFVHCGSNSTWRNATGNAAGVDLMLNTPPGGVFSAATPTFTRVQLATSGDWYDVKLANVNTDGLLDVVAVGNLGGASVKVWLQPTPVFPALGATAAQWALVVPQSSLLNSSSGFATAHVGGLAVGKITNGDLLADIAYAQQDYASGLSFAVSPYHTNGGRVSTMKGAGNGTFSGLATTPGQSVPYGTALNGVGIIPTGTGGNVVASDAAAGYSKYSWAYSADSAGQCAVWESTTASDLFGTWKTLDKAGTYCTECLCAATGDVNGDGAVDVVIPSGNTFIGAATQAVFAFINTGTTFSMTQATAGSAGAERYAAVFDIDFDAVLDCAVTVATNRVDFFKGRTGTLGLQFKSSVQVLANSPNVSRVAGGDFDNDGRNDVCVATSFLADNGGTINNGSIASPTADRGLGGVQGVFILLNTSN